MKMVERKKSITHQITALLERCVREKKKNTVVLGNLKLAQANLKAVENVLAFHHDCFLGAFLVIFTAVWSMCLNLTLWHDS